MRWIYRILLSACLSAPILSPPAKSPHASHNFYWVSVRRFEKVFSNHDGFLTTDQPEATGAIARPPLVIFSQFWPASVLLSFVPATRPSRLDATLVVVAGTKPKTFSHSPPIPSRNEAVFTNRQEYRCKRGNHAGTSTRMCLLLCISQFHDRKDVTHYNPLTLIGQDRTDLSNRLACPHTPFLPIYWRRNPPARVNQ